MVGRPQQLLRTKFPRQRKIPTGMEKNRGNWYKILMRAKFLQYREKYKKQGMISSHE